MRGEEPASAAHVVSIPALIRCPWKHGSNRSTPNPLFLEKAAPQTPPPRGISDLSVEPQDQAGPRESPVQSGHLSFVLLSR